MKRGVTLVALLLGSWLSGTAIATTVGVFNIAGTMTVTQNTITWTSNIAPFPADKANIGPGATGIYSALGGTTITIHDLNRATEPIGVSFPATSFISFDAAPALSSLLINFIFAGIYDPAGCAATPPAAGQTCTPSVANAPSPFSFLNTQGAGSAVNSTATFAMQGVSADGLDTWFGNFTSQFTSSFQQVLAAFAPGGSGSFTNTYSATITVNSASTSVPEPSTIVLLAIALMAMAGLGHFTRRTGTQCSH